MNFYTKYFFYFKKFDLILFINILLLICFGLTALYSLALSQGEINFLKFKKQIFFALGGLVILIVLSLLDYKLLANYSRFFYWTVFFLLALVLIFGHTLRGTRGWFSLSGFYFQPVELAKIILLIFLSKFFSERARELNRFIYVLASAAGTGLLVFLVLLQPDFGSALVLFFLWFFLLLIIGIPRLYLFSIVSVILLLFAGSWFFLFQDYQKARIMTFLNPGLDPLGRGYNITQAVIGVGAGGWWGRGLGFGSQSQLKFIPEAHTDFIFAVIAEEFGLLGVFLILLLFAVFFWRIIRIAKRARDDFALFLSLGIGLLFFIQLFINIGMNIGLAPVTGITLPFLSYGGSSLITSLLMIGFLESIASRS